MYKMKDSRRAYGKVYKWKSLGVMKILKLNLKQISSDWDFNSQLIEGRRMLFPKFIQCTTITTMGNTPNSTSRYRPTWCDLSVFNTKKPARLQILTQSNDITETLNNSSLSETFINAKPLLSNGIFYAYRITSRSTVAMSTYDLENSMVF